MNSIYHPGIKVGILGGGQLGRMLIQAGVDLNIDFHVLDPDPNAPCAGISRFTCGKLTDFKTVVNFGQDCDLITIEIEHVNTEALKHLAAQGIRVFPEPEAIECIQDKRIQKSFYQNNGIPTSPFVLTENRHDVRSHASFLPAVNKLGKDGYDGRGVQVLRSEADLDRAFDAPGLLEKWVEFEKEIAVLVARSATGEVRTFPAVEMMFHPTGNMVEFLFSPASIPAATADRAAHIATNVISKLQMTGLLAVEMFVTHAGDVLVNESAPRPHNSGHQTIEGNCTSQYHQHLRAILGLPLGETSILIPSAMVNLLGEEGHSGVAHYEGIEECLAIEGVHVHLYGKLLTKPLRKMGHVSITGIDPAELRAKARRVKDTLRVVSR